MHVAAVRLQVPPASAGHASAEKVMAYQLADNAILSGFSQRLLLDAEAPDFIRSHLKEGLEGDRGVFHDAPHRRFNGELLTCVLWDYIGVRYELGGRWDTGQCILTVEFVNRMGHLPAVDRLNRRLEQRRELAAAKAKAEIGWGRF